MRFNKLSSIILLSAAVAAITLGSGCGALERKAYRQDVISTRGPVIASNVVTETRPVMVAEAATNIATGVITPAQFEVKTFPVATNLTFGPSILTTNLVDIPEIKSTIIAGVGSLPVPFAGAAAVALGWLYSAYAAFRNKKAATALVTGIEAARTILQTTPEGQALDHKVKDALIKHQELAGVLDFVGKIVNAKTGDTVTAPLPQPAKA